MGDVKLAGVMGLFLGARRRAGDPHRAARRARCVGAVIIARKGAAGGPQDGGAVRSVPRARRARRRCSWAPQHRRCLRQSLPYAHLKRPRRLAPIPPLRADPHRCPKRPSLTMQTSFTAFPRSNLKLGSSSAAAPAPTSSAWTSSRGSSPPCRRASTARSSPSAPPRCRSPPTRCATAKWSTSDALSRGAARAVRRAAASASASASASPTSAPCCARSSCRR